MMHRCRCRDEMLQAPCCSAHNRIWGLRCRRYQDAVVHDIEDRMAHWTHLPADHGEDLQVS